MLSGWAILGIAIFLIAVMIGSGIRLLWPTRRSRRTREDFGLALITGALVSAAVLSIQFLIDFRGRQEDHRRAEAAERQSLQISVGHGDLSGIDLSGARLKYFYLEGKRLKGANLANARLDRAILTQSTLVGANLNKAWLSGANLSGSRLTGAILDGAHLEDAQLYGSDLNGASLVDARLENAVLADARLTAALPGAHLDDAILDNTRFERANLIRADLRGTWLVGADFRKALLYGADFGATKQNPWRASRTLRYATLTDARYDKTTRWPPSRFAPPPCSRGVCFVYGHSGLPPAFKTFREKLAAVSPHGWTLELANPPGITLKSPGGDTEFTGDSLATGDDPDECERAYLSGIKTFRPKRPYEELHGLEVDHRPAVAARYGFADPARGRRMAIDVYFSQGGQCYRFRGVSPLRVFPLFRDSAARLFAGVGLTRGPSASGDMPWLAQKPPTARQAAAARSGSVRSARNASDSNK
jgi:uncharacterized protein YjbI with pentapeptide repeats